MESFKAFVGVPEFSRSSFYDSGLFVSALLLTALVGVVAIAYLILQWKRNISLRWMSMKAAARATRKSKTKLRTPEAHHLWNQESGYRGQPSTCCVCLKSFLPPQSLGPVAISNSSIQCCIVCGVAAHLSCSKIASRDCKCVAQADSQQLLHHWTEVWNEIEDIPETSYYCTFCKEPCYASYLAVSPIWRCLWCQRLVHIECHTKMLEKLDVVCDLGFYKGLLYHHCVLKIWVIRLLLVGFCVLLPREQMNWHPLFRAVSEKGGGRVNEGMIPHFRML